MCLLWTGGVEPNPVSSAFAVDRYSDCHVSNLLTCPEATTQLIKQYLYVTCLQVSNLFAKLWSHFEAPLVARGYVWCCLTPSIHTVPSLTASERCPCHSWRDCAVGCLLMRLLTPGTAAPSLMAVFPWLAAAAFNCMCCQQIDSPGR